MPTQPLTSFASAAASNGNSEGGSNNRGLGGSGDWSRPRTNGATATFRRSSQANSNAHARDTSSTASNVYVPPHAAASFSSRASTSDLKYSREQLLDMFKALALANESNNILADSLTEGWQPGASIPSGNAGWARREDPKEAHTGPDICWEQTATVKPLGLIDMDEEEKELFSTSVNSPLKPPPQNTAKDGTQTSGINGRKSSISQMQGLGGHLPSMQTGRPGARRRETSDSIPSNNPLASPTAFGRSGREDSVISTPPSSLIRRRTDLKELGSTEKAKPDTSLDTSSPFGSLKRTTTGPMSAGLNGPSSPWTSGTQSAGFGAFGNFAIESSGQPSTPGEKKLGFGSMRGESRFKGLMSKESSEDIGSRSKEKQGLSLLERLGETDNDVTTSRWGQSPVAKDNTSLGERVGSAALGGEDSSPPQRTFSGMDQRRAQEDIGFAGLTRDSRIHETPQANQRTSHFDGSMSPTGTNPFQSPEGDLSHEVANELTDDSHANPYGIRPQPSSAHPNRGFSGLQGFGNLNIGGSGGWSAAPGPIGSAGRVSSAFSPSGYQDTVFGSMGEVSSPGGVFGAPGNAFGAIGRGSGRMSSLFPTSMQDQMRNDHGFGDFGQGRGTGMGAFGIPTRDTDSPSRTTRGGPLDDLFGNFDNRSRAGQGVSSPFAGESLQRPDSVSLSGAPQASGASATAGTSPPNSASQDSNQMPAAQKRQMVMPDRMRWIYRDPAGNTQGPWSGLEMHDWYKAGFFSPELLVKKQEDTDYEPLAQLIRRIGNSREPFLVPQIGIPHGAVTTQPGGPALGLAAAGPQPGAAQPPFPSSFPSFGTTLTAQQQNDLERRKQEEQFLMARQKEQLAAHQAMIKNMQMSGVPHSVHQQALNHHSSTQSLHSQPSFGSITSPSGYQPSPGQGALPHAGVMPGFFDRPGHAFGGFPGDAPQNRENDPFDRLNLGRSTQSPYGAFPLQSQEFGHQQQVNVMLQDRARLQAEQEQAGDVQPDEQESKDRLEHFQQLRSQAAPSSQEAMAQEHSDIQSVSVADESIVETPEKPSPARPSKISIPTQEQAPPVQQVVAPPAPSISPLPAPAAQRNRQHVAETLAADSRSRSQTPSVDTPSAALAPWAKESTESTKGPSLKEIQEAEAKKAAQQEEIAAAARRQLAEQERILAANAQAQVVAGLPSGANWAASASPTTANAASAWAKRPAVATPTATNKKTLAQIQKEEEARKNRAVAAAAAAANNANLASTANLAGGKRYADLASKVTPAGPAVGGAWTTVGASGKVKVPVGPSVPAPQRTVSGSVVSQAAKPKPSTPVRANTANANAQSAQEEFQKWAKNALGTGLNSSINVDNFVRDLLQLPTEPEMLSDAVYANSQTLDGRRFAEEFVRRRKLADKGVAPEASAASNFSSGGSGANDGKGSGGWSEVAKKGPPQAEKASEVSAFKVVAPKKKGKR